MKVRAAVQSDIPAIMEIERLPGFEQFFGQFSEDEHSGHIVDMDCRVLVVEDENSISGFALLRGFAANDGNIRLNRLAVSHPERGLGQILLDAAISLAFDNPAINRFWLRVATSNSRARHFYERNGFLLESIMAQAGTLPTGEVVDIALYGLMRKQLEQVQRKWEPVSRPESR